MKISSIAQYIRQHVVDLVKQGHILTINIFHGNAAFFPKRHRPVTIEGTAGTNADRQGVQRRITPTTHSKEIPYRKLPLKDLVRHPNKIEE
jgi:hypothetical protein